MTRQSDTQDNWNFYFGQVDGAPSSTFVNLSLAERAPVAGFADCVYLSLSMRAPREDGLSSRQERESLGRIEDRLAGMIAQQGGIFAGRVTHAGKRDFFAYFRQAQAAKTAFLAFEAEFPEYRMEIGARTDPQWQIYSGYLYPNSYGAQHIRNREVLAALRAKGDALSLPRQIEHFAYFPDVGAARAFAAAAAEAGFAITTLGQIEDGSGEVMVQFRRDDAPDQIDSVTDAIIGALAGAVGRYDGWGCNAIPAN